MARAKAKPFKMLAVRHQPSPAEASVFALNDDPGQCVDPLDDLIDWVGFSVYGVHGSGDDAEEALERLDEDDFSMVTTIGKITGWHVPISTIESLGADAHDACDTKDAHLEAMYSALCESDDLEDDLMDFDARIYCIDEIAMEPAYHGMGYEGILLKQLPGILVKALRALPSLLVVHPAPTQYMEPERNEEAEAILAHRLAYNFDRHSEKEDKIVLFPPVQEVPLSEINRVLGRRNPGETVPQAHRNQSLYALYEAAGFEEIGQTGWLYKRIASIYTEDGLNH
ncbi:MAG: hypothetical protein LBM74_06260 [Oscillospiraceae bacterium]|jgi:hypothetical protein|nr:hypothetical protein [Oscillospiraceae bacterium]